MVDRTPEPVLVQVCSVCRRPWADHLDKSPRVRCAATDEEVRFDDFVLKTDELCEQAGYCKGHPDPRVQVTLEYCVLVLVDAVEHTGPRGPMGYQGVMGIAGEPGCEHVKKT